MKLLYILTIVLGLWVGASTFARAHAFLDRAEPKVGATVATPPASVKIWFTRALVVPGSKIEVFDAKGAEVDGKDARLDRSDASLLSVSVTTLPPGTYKVVWNAVCRDSHHTTGTFDFTISGPKIP